MILRFFLLAGIFLFASCTAMGERNSPYDPESPNYIGNRLSSSQSVVPVPSSSSSSKPSSSSITVKSSSSKVNVSGGCPNAVIGNNTISCGGQSYNTVKIGEQVWMAENLNYAVEGSKCGGDDGKLKDENTSYCDTYGRFYNWATAVDVCPSGWHLPSNEDWNVLMKFVNPSCSDNSTCNGAGTKLKAAIGWNESTRIPVGTNNYGFSALPGGLGLSDGSFDDVGYSGYWLSSSEYNAKYAYRRYMYYGEESAGYSTFDKSALISVRCLQN